MKIVSSLCGSLAILIMLVGTLAKAENLDATKLLKDAEYIRNPQEDYQVKVALVDTKNKKSEEHTYETLVKGRRKSLVRFLTPVADKGTKVLMIDDQMWIFVPSTSKPIRIAPRQKVMGNAAYGDIVRLSFDDNYNAKVVREDTFKDKKAIVLDLTAIDGRPVTYDRVEYWIESSSHRPLKALYQTMSGKTLREGYFEKFENVLGVQRPTRFILSDFLQKEHITTLEFTDAKLSTLPDLLFDKQNFGRD